jgi:hypothetical protein
MSRFLTAFRTAAPAHDEKSGFSETYMPNKSKKANNQNFTTADIELHSHSNRARGFSDYSGYSEPSRQKNALFEEGAAPASDAALPATHIRPPSWSDPANVPTSGARCYCCKFATWWTEAKNPTGWCCAICHPPGHLSARQFREVNT